MTVQIASAILAIDLRGTRSLALEGEVDRLQLRSRLTEQYGARLRPSDRKMTVRMASAVLAIDVGGTRPFALEREVDRLQLRSRLTEECRLYPHLLQTDPSPSLPRVSAR